MLCTSPDWPVVAALLAVSLVQFSIFLWISVRLREVGRALGSQS
jgi:hypothetical protein